MDNIGDIRVENEILFVCTKEGEPGTWTEVPIKKQSPERLYLDNFIRHVSRYEFASHFIERGGVVLDCACGSGYGSEILAKHGNFILAIDRSAESIEYAMKFHKNNHISYGTGIIEELDFKEQYFNAVVSLETIEHLEKDVMIKYLQDISRWVKLGGSVVISSPMLRYNEEGEPFVTNPYHLSELDKVELISILESIFGNYSRSYFHQKENKFLPLLGENTGFCIFVARRYQ